MNTLYGVLGALFAQADKAPLIVPDSVQKANFAEAVNRLMNLDFSEISRNLLSEALWVVIKIVIALAVYYIGRWVLHRLIRLLEEV